MESVDIQIDKLIIPCFKHVFIFSDKIILKIIMSNTPSVRTFANQESVSHFGNSLLCSAYQTEAQLAANSTSCLYWSK